MSMPVPTSTSLPAVLSADDEDFFATLASQTKLALNAMKAEYISTKGKLFTFPSGHATTELDCIVVAFNRVNALMPPYNPNQYQDPKCWAIGDDVNAMAPDPNQVAEAQDITCLACPKNKYGTAANGGKGKACTNRIRLAIVPVDANADSDISIINVSPTGLTRWTGYYTECERAFGSGGFSRCITQIRFMAGTTFPSLTFKAEGPIKDPTIIRPLYFRAREILLASPSRDE